MDTETRRASWRRSPDASTRPPPPRRCASREPTSAIGAASSIRTDNRGHRRQDPPVAHDDAGDRRPAAAEQVEADRRVGDVVAQRVAERPLQTAEAELRDAGDDVGDDDAEAGELEYEAVGGGVTATTAAASSVERPRVGRRRDREDQQVEDDQVLEVEQLTPRRSVGRQQQHASGEDRRSEAIADAERRGDAARPARRRARHESRSPGTDRRPRRADRPRRMPPVACRPVPRTPETAA